MARVAGTVVEVRDGRAWVECRAETAGCGACATGHGCAWRTRAGVARRLTVPGLLDGRPLETGEPVELEADEARLLAAALRLYLPPLCGLLAGPALMRGLAWEPGAVPLLAGAVGLLAGSVVARAWTRHGPAIALRRP
jgi:positive regulator of sigma E activity